MTVAEKDVDQYKDQQNLSFQGDDKKDNTKPDTSQKTDEKNWFTAAATIQHIKEGIVIVSAASVLCWLMFILTKLVFSVVDLFSEAVRLHSAPIAVVKTMDWHVLGLGVSLIVGVSAISIILMKSVFSSGEKQTPDGLKISDLPVGEFLESVKTWFKR